jgi:hypothetical protein
LTDTAGPSERKNIGRALLAAALLLIGLPVGCFGVHRRSHPAPLGRDVAQIERNLDQVIPPGTQFDSVTRFLEGHSLPFGVCASTDAGCAADSLFAGGQTIFVSQAGTQWALLYTWRAVVELFFDSTGSLRSRRVKLSAETPL